VSWVDLISELEVNEQRPFPFDKANSIRPLISGRIALMYPERTYETERSVIKIKKIDTEVLIVKRTA
jgi:hypothetical protein